MGRGHSDFSERPPITIGAKKRSGTHGSPNLGQKTIPNNSQQKNKRTCKIVDFAVPVDHKIKLKECEKKDRELKKTVELEGDNYTNCNWYVWNSN